MNIDIIHFVIVSIIAILLGQLTLHLTKKIPTVVKEEITYKEFFKSLRNDFKLDFIYSILYLILFNLILYFNGENLKTYLYLFLSFALVIETSVDIRFRLIPDEVHIVIAVLGLVNLVFDSQNALNYILGAAVGGGIFLGLGLISILILKKEGMGFGDVKLMLSLGFFFGVKNILVVTLISFVFGAIIGGALLIIKNKDSDGYIPFGPFIAIGAAVLMFIPADAIIEIYITFCSWLGFKMTDAVYFVAQKFGLIKY